MLETVDKERMTYTCNKIVENPKIIENNAKFWTLYLDNQLKEFVILYNFNFFEVANRFHGYISIENRYNFNENEIRRHWSFLHSMRYLNRPVDNEYYTEIKKKFKIEEELREQKVIDEESPKREETREKKRKEEEEEIKRNLEIIQKLKYERFNLITIDTNVPQSNEENGKNEFGYNREIEMDRVEVIKKEEDRKISNVASKVVKDSKELNKFNDDFNGKKEEKVNTENSNNDKNNLKTSNDFFESDEFINDIFKNQTRLKEKIVLDNKDEKIDNLDQIEPYEADLFPINTTTKSILDNIVNDPGKDKNFISLEAPKLSNEDNLDYRHKIAAKYEIENMEKNLENTMSFDDLIRDDHKLKEQYENLNTYYNFAVKSLNYFIPKLGKGLNDEPNTTEEETNTNETIFEEDVIKKTSFKINQLLIDSVNNN
jgi:hypothetical protein